MAKERDIAATITGDGMPLGNRETLPLQRRQIELDPHGIAPPTMDDDAAATLLWNDFRQAANWLDSESWLMEWQYIDYIYQSPNYDRDFRSNQNRAARISRFNVAKNSNTMKNQVRRAMFPDKQFFILEPKGQLASDPDAQTYIDAWTTMFSVLCDRSDFEYHFGRLFIASQVLQGTGIGVPRWEQKKVIRTRREPRSEPVKIDMPMKQASVQVNTWQSDDWKVVEETKYESYPSFEHRRLGTTIWDEKWRTPGRPDLSATYRYDIDYVNFTDLQQMREMSCYKDIPSDEDLIRFFLLNPYGDAESAQTLAQNSDTTALVHAAGEHRQMSANPFLKPLLKISRWSETHVEEMLCYLGRKKIIRNEKHKQEGHALGYTANWYDIADSGYGFGVGRLNAGDQRMTQGVLNEALKMIAFPMNAPLLYDADSGNAPTQNTIAGLGTFLAVHTGQSKDINKSLSFLRVPEIPPEAWRIYELAQQGGEDLVGANQATMQGQLGGPGSSFGRTATGANRLSSKADENISDPVDQCEMVIRRYLEFLWKMVLEEMPIKEIREILSDKMGTAILTQIDARKFLNVDLNIKILAGDKLKARAAISQLIPFMLQLVQQPQLLEFMHQKGWTVNYLTIERLFMQMSELAGRDDIIVPLTDQEKQQVQAMQPGIQRIQQLAAVEKLKGGNKLQAIDHQGAVDLQNKIAEQALEHASGSVPLDLAEARYSRNSDLSALNNGVVQ